VKTSRSPWGPSLDDMPLPEVDEQMSSPESRPPDIGRSRASQRSGTAGAGLLVRGGPAGDHGHFAHAGLASNRGSRARPIPRSHPSQLTQPPAQWQRRTAKSYPLSWQTVLRPWSGFGSLGNICLRRFCSGSHSAESWAPDNGLATTVSSIAPPFPVPIRLSSRNLPLNGSDGPPSPTRSAGRQL
jgi:hypothetical protein